MCVAWYVSRGYTLGEMKNFGCLVPRVDAFVGMEFPIAE